MTGDGSSTSASVLACPPDTCLALGCPGHEFWRKGLLGCGIPTASSPVGATFTVTFHAFNPAAPGRSATATRAVTVVSPCTPGEVHCPDVPEHPCGSTPCSARRLLLAQADLAALETADEALLPPRVRFSAAMIPEFVKLTADPQHPWPQATLSVSVPCSTPAPFPMELCTDESTGNSCGVVAEVLQAGVVLEPQTPLQLYRSAGVRPDRACSAVSIAGGTCTLCSAPAIAAGLCVAGWHELTYTARSPALGLSNAVVIRATVMQRLAAAEVAVLATLRVPAAAATDVSLDGLVTAISGGSTVTNEALWAAREVLQDVALAGAASVDCAAVTVVLGQRSLMVELQRATAPISSFLSRDAVSGDLTIEVCLSLRRPPAR